MSHIPPGYCLEKDGRYFIPIIIAKREGSGDVGRFLDTLDPRCIIPNLTSDRLRGMLERRGWKQAWVLDPIFRQWVDEWHHPDS